MLNFVNSEIFNIIFFSLCCLFIVLTFIAFFYATLKDSTKKDLKYCDSLENKQYSEFLEYIKEKQSKNEL